MEGAETPSAEISHQRRVLSQRGRALWATQSLILCKYWTQQCDPATRPHEPQNLLHGDIQGFISMHDRERALQSLHLAHHPPPLSPESLPLLPNGVDQANRS